MKRKRKERDDSGHPYLHCEDGWKICGETAFDDKNKRLCVRKKVFYLRDSNDLTRLEWKKNGPEYVSSQCFDMKEIPIAVLFHFYLGDLDAWLTADELVAYLPYRQKKLISCLGVDTPLARDLMVSTFHKPQFLRWFGEMNLFF